MVSTYHHHFWYGHHSRFLNSSTITNSKGTPSLTALYGGVENLWFLTKIAWYKIGPWLLWITNRKSQVLDWSMRVPTTLTDPERRDAKAQFSGTFGHSSSTHRGEQVSKRSGMTAIPRGRVPVPFVIYIHPHDMTHFARWSNYRIGNFFTGQPCSQLWHECWHVICYCC